MKTYNEICSGGQAGYVGTGATDQCLEAVTVLLVLAKTDFRFDSLADFKDKTKWDAGILAGNLVPLFELYDLAPANTDATFYENRNFKKRTAKALKIMTAESYVGVCSQAALKSYHNSSDYTRVFEVTEDGDVMGVYDTDGVKVKGQLISDFNVGIRNPATTEKPPFTIITVSYADYEEFEDGAVIASPDFDPVMDLEGVFNVSFTQTGATPSETSIVVNATVGCKGEILTGAAAEIKLYAPDGTVTDGVAAETAATGLYTITGTGFVTGSIVMIDGIKAVGDINVSGGNKITIP